MLSATSDASGGFRFPSVAPGVYEVTATLASFAPQKFADVTVGLGQIKRLEFALGLAGVAESVSVTAESPIVDVKQTARQTNIRAEQVELLPHGRDFTTMVTQAPGANQEPKLGGLSIDGASAGENRYIIDGIETTNLQSGISGKNLIADFVDEVQVKSSGYTAEFGGAMGGVINVVTKSGSNDFHGSGVFNFQGSALSSGSSPATGQTFNINTGVRSLRLNLADATKAEYVTYPEDDVTRIEPGFSLGGPISVNRAWFYGAYMPALTSTTRDVDAASSVNPAANAASIKQTQQTQFLTLNQTGQLGQNLRSRVAFNNSWAKTDGLLPSPNGTDPSGTNYSKTSVFPNWSLSGNLDWVASPKLFFGARGGYYVADQHDTNVTEEPRVLFGNTTNVGMAGVPVSLQRAAGFASIPSNNKVTRDQQTRLYFQADGTTYANFGGQHQIKFGVQVDRIGNNVLSGEAAARVSVFWDAALSSGVPVTRGQYGYYSVRSNAVAPRQGFITEGNIHSNLVGLFIQDAWTIKNRLTLQVGLRTEDERVPTYTTGEDIPEFGLKFPFSEKLAPRLGAAYDLKGDGRTKLFTSWGIFYDIFKLELPRGSFGGDKWLEYYYALDTADWTTLVSNPSCPPSCAGTIIRGAPTADNPVGGIDFRHPSFGADSIDPDLRPMRVQEATAGVEHQLNNYLALSARYVHKHVIRAIEDTGSLDAEGNEIYVIANPGENLTALAFTNPNVNLPKPQRDYDSVELAAEKRLSNNWYLRASYSWSRLYGNYSGLTQSDENGRTSPNVGRLFDYPLMQFQDGGIAAFGPLPTDRPHQFKANFIYQFTFGTAIGANQWVASGLPVSREIGIYPPNTLPVQYLGRGSDGRTPMFSQTDLLIQQEFRLGGSNRLQLSFNVLNLFNQDTAVSRHSTYQRTGGITPNEALFYTGQQTLASLIQSQSASLTPDPRFLLDNSFQQPIVARVGVKFLF